jgi:asparagine synthase (glutamine-hydrolysing)
MQEHERFFERVRNKDPLSQQMYVDLKTFLPCLNLMYTDKMSMAASVEVREPFLDYRLVEFFSRMPSHLKLHGLTRKYALKKAAERIIPPSIAWRRKAGFGAPIHAWISGDLKDLMEDVLSDSVVRKRGYFEASYCRHLLNEELSGREYYSNHLWQLLTLELWHRTFIDTY